MYSIKPIIKKRMEREKANRITMLWNESELGRTGQKLGQLHLQPLYYEEHQGNFPLKFFNLENGFYKVPKGEDHVENNFGFLKGLAPKREAYGIDNLTLWHPHITQSIIYKNLIENLNKDEMDMVNLN